MSTQDQAYDGDDPLPNHQDESSYPTETDYYALLNLPRSPAPTESQIRSAYRTLALSFHPDKQPAQWHDAAGRHFAQIRAAYDTLVDPQKRAVYDLLGAEGVRAEWGPQGAMGVFGEARKQERRGEVGVRAMKPEEFRRWFLGVMKKRERVAVNRLVQCRSSVSLGIDAAGLIIVDEDDEVYVGIPTLQTNAFSVGCSFKTPLPTPRVIFGESEKEDDDDESAEQEGEAPVETDMVINAGVKGQLRHLTREGTPLPLLMVANNITLGASINRPLDDLARPKGFFGERFSSLFTNAGCAANFLVLPAPILQTAYAKAYTPIPGTRPFTVQTSALFKNSPFKCMPTIGLQITKPIAQRKTVFCSWSSGTLDWPYLFERLFGLGAHADDVAQEASSFQLGYTSLPKLSRSLATQDDEDDDDIDAEDEEDLAFEMARHQLRAEDQAAESWQTVAMASPGAGGLSVTYSRNLFSGKAANEPRRSEWSGEGHHPLPQEVEPRSVRLEIQTSLALDLSLSWVVEGTRQVGEFTRMGLGVGLTDAQGLVMTFSWSRLGQKIQIPVKICPLDSVTSDASTLALVAPWALYCAVEFGIIRPRDRRNRRRAIARRHRQLKKLIPKHRADSLQAIELMAEQTRRRQAREESQGGLVITKAEYGHYPSGNKKRVSSEGTGPRPDEVADVTVPVAALVDRGQLVIAKDMVKFHILGFYDPAPLLSKSLKIWYLYHGKEHFVEVKDAEGVACPMRSHLI
ncbi:hypothetical protein BDW42DRAFT_176449 [Aspergillus taichungensis]|uniref:J domain-containing protein n=1 Tax=Aspergillus taichungensis TaxID=482145 RepID=A0A2J5HKK3_9EURO|nr:hypothetical protein BDW42DRAFT_176449 [Aspergillus taichungensis]